MTDEAAPAVDAPPPSSSPGGPHPTDERRGRFWRVSGGVAVWLLLAVSAVWIVVRLAGLDGHTPFAQLVSYTPYVVAVPLLALAIGAVLRRWTAAVVALAAVLVFAGFVLPRAVADGPAGGGVRLRVLTLNLLGGGADPGPTVALIRRERPDVLLVQELTPEGVRMLDAAGLADVLRYRELRPGPMASGTGIYARWPLAGNATVDTVSTFDMTRSVLLAPGGDVEVIAVHPPPPLPGPTSGRWRRDLALLPPASSSRAQVLAGDFNATLDHSAVRRLLATGYRDAAASTGDGLVPTWPELGHPGVPPVTIDHVLTNRRNGVRAYDTHIVPGTDHRAVTADLVLRS